MIDTEAYQVGVKAVSRFVSQLLYVVRLTHADTLSKKNEINVFPDPQGIIKIL